MAADLAGLLPLVHYCGTCSDPAIDLEAAVECCGGPAALGYLCPVCGFPYATEAAAIACCEWDRTPEGARAITRRLEEAGQLPLEL